MSVTFYLNSSAAIFTDISLKNLLHFIIVSQYYTLLRTSTCSFLVSWAKGYAAFFFLPVNRHKLHTVLLLKEKIKLKAFLRAAKVLY